MLQIRKTRTSSAHAHAHRLSLRHIATVATAASGALLMGFASRVNALPIGQTAQQPLLGGLDEPSANVTFTKDTSIGFAIVGDYGQAGRDEERVADMVKSWKPAFIATTGDNNYPLGRQSTIDVNVGQYYHEFIRFDRAYNGEYSLRGSKEQNFFPALGNHDWMTKKAKPFTRTFDLPGNRRFYNVQRGPVEMFIIDSDLSEPEGVHKKSHQAQWLKHRLKHSTATWKLVTMHHAPYSTGNHGCNTYMQWPFEKWGASAVIAGHDHIYERVIMNGFPYFVNGVGGATLDKHKQGNVAGADEDFAYDKRHGAMRLHADEEHIVFCFFNEDRKLIDAYLMPNGTRHTARAACDSL